MSLPLLAVEDLVGGYGATRILHGVTLEVAEGGTTALLGANGAGKTTLMKTLCGLLPATGGRIRWRGDDITASSCAERVRAGLVLVPEGRMVFPGLSVQENLRLGAVNSRTRLRWRAGLDRVYQLFPRLRERSRQLAATLSGGEQQMLAIGRGLMAEPTLMLLDEPTLGLAPMMAAEMFDLVNRLAAESITVLLAEQDVRRTLSVAQYGYVVENGRVATHGTARNFADDPRIRQAYLGL
jgi:branched-chain amino acid transport system ATP-binding protein